MKLDNYYIKADIFGKTKYWECIHGLHSGQSERMGFSMFSSVKSAKKEIRRLKKIFHSAIIFSVIAESKLPFIKKQRKRLRK